MDEIKQFAGRQAEFMERIPGKAAIWDGLKTEIALHARTKQDRDELRLRLDAITASYEALKARFEDALSMAVEPEEGELTPVERLVLGVEVRPHG